MSAHYKQRLESLIQQLIGELLEQEAYDPRLEGIVVTDVELNEDNSVAKVYTMGGGEDSFQGLRKAGSFLRAELGKRLKLRNAPLLRFHEDESLDRYNRIDGLLEHEVPADAKADGAAEDSGEAEE